MTEQRKHSLSGKSGPETKGFFKSILPPNVEVVTDDACRGVDLAIGDIFKWPGKDTQRDPVGCAVEMPVHRQLNGTMPYVEIGPCQGRFGQYTSTFVYIPRPWILVCWHDAVEYCTPMT